MLLHINLRCPPGAFCAGINKVAPLAGFWRFDLKKDRKDTLMLRCNYPGNAALALVFFSYFVKLLNRVFISCN